MKLWFGSLRYCRLLSLRQLTTLLNVAQCNVRKSKDPSQTQTACETEEIRNKMFLSPQIVLFQLNF